MSHPLSGIRVVEFSHMVMGPSWFRQHPLMQYTGNQNAARFLPVKYHMLALLHAPEARSNFMEGIGSRATILFELEGLRSEKRNYLRWLLAQSVAPKAVVKALLNRRE